MVTACLGSAIARGRHSRNSGKACDIGNAIAITLALS